MNEETHLAQIQPPADTTPVTSAAITDRAARAPIDVPLHRGPRRRPPWWRVMKLLRGAALALVPVATTACIASAENPESEPEADQGPETHDHVPDGGSEAEPARSLAEVCADACEVWFDCIASICEHEFPADDPRRAECMMACQGDASEEEALELAGDSECALVEALDGEGLCANVRGEGEVEGEGEGGERTIGEDCARQDDCASGICIEVDGLQYCSEACTDGICPDGFVCRRSSRNGFCVRG